MYAYRITKVYESSKANGQILMDVDLGFNFGIKLWVALAGITVQKKYREILCQELLVKPLFVQTYNTIEKLGHYEADIFYVDATGAIQNYGQFLENRGMTAVKKRFKGVSDVWPQPKLYEYAANYISNYDGDTIKLLLSLGFNCRHNLTVRLLGCDTFEMNDPDPAKKTLALQGKQFTMNLLSGDKSIVVTTVRDETDKYGRMLANVTVKIKNTDPGSTILNKALVENGLTTGKWSSLTPV